MGRRALLRFQNTIICCCLSSGVSYNSPIEEFTLIVASWVIRARWRGIRRFVLEYKVRYFYLNSDIRCFLFETSNLRVQRNNTLNLECKEVGDQFLQKLDFSYIFRDSTVSTLQKMYGKTAPTVTGIISPDRQKFFSFAQDRKRWNQKHRLRQEIPCLCRQLVLCFVQYYRQIICIAFCKLWRNFRFFCQFCQSS